MINILKTNKYNLRLSIAAFVTVTLLMWVLGVPLMFNTAGAAGYSEVSDTLQTSNPNTLSNHTLDFIIPSGLTTGETITITFPGTFDMSNLLEDDIDVATGTDWTTATDCSGTEQAGVDITGQVITITACDATEFGSVPIDAQIIVEIGSNATFSGAGLDVRRIENPSTGTYQIDLAGTNDTGFTRVLIIDDVTISANVDSTFDFAILPVASGKSVNGTTTSIGSSATSIPFGVLTAGTSVIIAQELTVTTNAKNGYSVTVEQSGNIQSSTGADINKFVDGTAVSSPQSWVSPSPSLGDSTTYGHFGYTTEDGFGSNLWAGDLSATVATTVMSHTGVADGSTPGIGSTTVGYQIEISSFQEAGTDYSNTLTYVATPKF